MYDLDTIEKMQQRYEAKQKKYQQVRNQLGIQDQEQKQDQQGGNAQISNQIGNEDMDIDHSLDSNRNQNHNQTRSQQRKSRDYTNKNRLPGTRRINFTILKKQIGYHRWNMKNNSEKSKIRNDYIEAYDKRLWTIDSQGRMIKRNENYVNEMENIRRNSRELGGTKFINWYRYANQFSESQWLNMTEEQKNDEREYFMDMYDQGRWAVDQKNWIYLNLDGKNPSDSDDSKNSQDIKNDSSTSIPNRQKKKKKSKLTALKKIQNQKYQKVKMKKMKKRKMK